MQREEHGASFFAFSPPSLRPVAKHTKMFPLSSSSPAILLTILFFLLSTELSISINDQQTKTIYDVLQSNGLPIGLLPKGVSNYSVDDRGRFEVHLDQACYAKFEDRVHYETNIRGTLSYGRIGALNGVAAQELFLWFPVRGIRVDVPSSGLIYFDVGVIKKQFSLSLFETPPECKTVDDRSGFNILHRTGVDELLKDLYEYHQDIQRPIL